MSFGLLRRLNQVLGVLALISQLALGTMVLPDAAAAADPALVAFDALNIICDSTTPAGPDQPPAPHRHAPDAAICPLGVALAMPAVILAAPPTLPALSVRRVERLVLPQSARGPPAPPRRTALPRGPPILA